MMASGLPARAASAAMVVMRPAPGRPRITSRAGRSGVVGRASASTRSRLSQVGTASSSSERSAWRMVATVVAPPEANGAPRRRDSSTGSTVTGANRYWSPGLASTRTSPYLTSGASLSSSVATRWRRAQSCPARISSMR